MQATQLLKVSAVQQEKLDRQEPISAELLEEIITANTGALGYMLQAYYTREKVSKVSLVPGTVISTDTDGLSFKMSYLKEEYNACSAVDTEVKDQMTVTVKRKADGSLHLTGENWPEL